MTDEADSSVVLAELQVAPFRECNNQRLSPWGRPFSCPPDPVFPQYYKSDMSKYGYLDLFLRVPSISR